MFDHSVLRHVMLSVFFYCVVSFCLALPYAVLSYAMSCHAMPHHKPPSLLYTFRQWTIPILVYTFKIEWMQGEVTYNNT